MLLFYIKIHSPSMVKSTLLWGVLKNKYFITTVWQGHERYKH